MATTAKTARTLVTAGTTNVAGGTTTGATWNLTTAFGGTMTAAVTNGGTSPAIGCDFVVQVSVDGSSWKEYSRQTAPTTASLSAAFAVEIPPGVLYARPQFSGNTAQSVTI